MHRLPILFALAAALAAADSAPKAPEGQDEAKKKAVAMSGVRLDFPPFYLETDAGGDARPDQEKFGRRFQKPIIETANFFLKVYNLKKNCFDEYAQHYSDKDGKFEKLIRLRIWKRYDDFLQDYQFRYESKSIPGAFFGINSLKDDYGKSTGTWIRELATAAEGETDEQVLRHMYHEMGHLFMKTFLVWQCEMPSWMEEGNAELFQYRIGNGTSPEAERSQRQGWLVEMIAEGMTVPWGEFIKVRNMDNLAFTHENPLRSTIQYIQAWSVMEFMIGDEQRAGAYNKLLYRYKAAAEKCCRDAMREGVKGDAFFDRVRPHLYTVQEAMIKECYGSDILAVEKVWKDWVRKTYEKDVAKRKPILRYHRGEWYVGPRLRHARDEAEKKALLAKGQTVFEECVQVSPEMPEGHVGLGRVAMARGDLAAASAAFDQALALGTTSFDAQLYGGIARVRKGDAAGAIDPLAKAYAQRSTHVEVNFFLGQALALVGKEPDRALVHLRRARDLDATETVGCALIEGAVQFHAGRLHQACLSWLRVLNDDPGNEMATLLLAVARAANNEEDEVLSLLGRAKSPAARAMLALHKSGKPLPKVAWRRGWPTLDFKGIVIDQDEEEPARPATAAPAR